MKNFILVALFFVFQSMSSQTTVKTVIINVDGACDDCKDRIENAADIKGVKLCNWSPDTKKAIVTYDESKVSVEQIEKAIASKGYDTEHFKGEESAYKKLPKCCQYRSNTEGLHHK